MKNIAEEVFLGQKRVISRTASGFGQGAPRRGGPSCRPEEAPLCWGPSSQCQRPASGCAQRPQRAARAHQPGGPAEVGEGWRPTAATPGTLPRSDPPARCLLCRQQAAVRPRARNPSETPRRFLCLFRRGLMSKARAMLRTWASPAVRPARLCALAVPTFRPASPLLLFLAFWLLQVPRVRCRRAGCTLAEPVP